MTGRFLSFVFVAGCLLAGANSAPYSKDDYDRLMTDLRELAEEDNLQENDDVDLPVPDDLREDETRYEQNPNEDEDAFEAEARSEQEPNFNTFMDNAEIARDEEAQEGFDEINGYEEDRSWEAPFENEDFVDEDDRGYEAPYNTYENNGIEDPEERGYESDLDEFDGFQNFNSMNGELEDESEQYQRELEDNNMANVDANEYQDDRADKFEEEILEDPAMRSQQMYEDEEDDLQDEEMEELARAIVASIDEEVPETIDRFEARATDDAKAPKPRPRPKYGKCKWISSIFQKADQIARCGYKMEKVSPKRDFEELMERNMNDDANTYDTAYGTMADEVDDKVAAAFARSILDTLSEDFSQDMDGLSKREDKPPKKPNKLVCSRLAKLMDLTERQAWCGIKLSKLLPVEAATEG